MYTFDVLPEFEPLAPDAIVLSPEAMDRALALAQRSPQTENQWQIYLTALALNGFEQWLSDRASDLSAERSHCTILSPLFMDATTAACNLQVNGYRLCIIGMESVFDETISIPSAAIDSPDCAAHFYVPIEVYEEQMYIRPRGFLRYDQLRQHQSPPLDLSPVGTYRLPLDWFESDLNRLLLFLNCLEPSAIALPSLAPSRQSQVATPARLHQILVQSAIYLRQWFRQRWSEVTQELSWTVLTPLEPAGAMRGEDTGMRSPDTAFTTILTSLERSGRAVPRNIQGMYRDWTFANYPLRLYVATAPVNAQDKPPEWSLLTILTMQNQANLPSGIRVQVSVGQTLVGEQVLSDSTPANYLYLTAIGTLEEQLTITISLADGTSLTLPPFSYS